jgi:hypothetical protein
LIREIRLVPEQGLLEIEIVGDLAAILALTERKRSAGKSGGPEITVVAGGGFEPPTFRL